VKGPYIDWAGMSPVLAAFGGALIVLIAGLVRSRAVREVFVPLLAIGAFLAFGGLSIWQWDEAKNVISGALRVDTFAMYLNLLIALAGVVTCVFSWRAAAPREAAHGEFYAMLLCSAGGMAVLVAAQNTITLFLGFELLSIPLYVLCATEMRRATSLESGLKYLIVGSVGSATLVYGLALLYGATGTTDFSGMSRALTESTSLADDSLMLGGIALVLVGLAFKASVAPFHQWTPDVYEGAPTSITAFMSVATKAAAFGVLLRMMDVALLPAEETWDTVVATLAAISIVVGNVGALGQRSLKRLLAWSSVAQAGYLLAGVAVASREGLQSTLFYLAVYLLMTLAAFAVVIARERETDMGDDVDAITGIGWSRPELSWPMTIAMLSLAGIPLTGGFIGKLYLLDATTGGGYTWLAIFIVLGSAVSLAYYLRVIVAIWMRPAPGAAAAAAAPALRPALAGGSSELDPPQGPSTADAVNASDEDVVAEAAADDVERGRRRRSTEVWVLGILLAGATLAAGIYPGPLFDLVREAGASLAQAFGG
jgi:NADH-quinone oxidoreductase subunit N